MKKIMIVALSVSCVAASATDLATAYRDALENDPELAVATANHKIAKEVNGLGALSDLLPSVSFSAGEGRSTTERSASVDAEEMGPGGIDFSALFSTSEVKSRSWSTSLSQNLIDVPSWFTYLSARNRSKSADWELERARQNLIYRVAEAYLAVLRSDELLESTIAAEEAIGRQLEQAQQRFDVGLVAITDVLNATADYDSAVVSRIQAAGNHGLFFESLRLITGVDYQQLATLSEDLPVVNPDPADENLWVNEALKNSPVVNAARLAYTAAKDDRRSALAAHLPTVRLSVSQSHSENPDNLFGQESDSESTNLSFSLPLFNGGRKFSNARRTLYAQEQARHQLKQSELTVSRGTRNLFRSVVTDVARVKANEKAIRSRQSALEATQTGYEVGTRNIVDVLNAQRQLYQSIYAYADSRYTYIQNSLQLKQTVGTLNEEDLMTINQYADESNAVTKVNSLSGK